MKPIRLQSSEAPYPKRRYSPIKLNTPAERERWVSGAEVSSEGWTGRGGWGYPVTWQTRLMSSDINLLSAECVIAGCQDCTVTGLGGALNTSQTLVFKCCSERLDFKYTPKLAQSCGRYNSCMWKIPHMPLVFNNLKTILNITWLWRRLWEIVLP